MTSLGIDPEWIGIGSGALLLLAAGYWGLRAYQRRARRKAALDGIGKIIGDAEELPFADDRFDRYVSTGSIEYWPDPQRAIVEAYRVVRPGGVALVAGPLQRTHPLARRLSDTWMLFPPEADYRAWMERAGFTDVLVTGMEIKWIRVRHRPMAMGAKPCGARPWVEPRITNRKAKVMTISHTSAAVMP